MHADPTTDAVAVDDRTVFATTRPTQSIMLISSEMAERLLSRNVKNRPISPTTVETYRRDMAAGRWVYAADPIRFDTNGDLQDGQHRLMAHSKCEGLSLPYLVVRGLAPEAQGVMDHGRKRLASQQLTMNNVRHATIVAAAARLYIAWDEGLLFKDTKQLGLITVPQIEQWVAEHQHLLDRINPIINKVRDIDAPPSIIITAAIRFSQIDADDADEFFTLLIEGAGTAGHPIVTLDKRLQRLRREGLKMPQRDYLALFITAWNAWREGRTISKFQRPRGGAWSVKTFPEAR